MPLVDGFARAIELDAPLHVRAASAQAADGLSGTPQLAVMRIGTHARPAWPNGLAIAETKR